MYTQLSIPNIPPKAVYQRSGRRRTEAPEEDRADSSATSVTLFASKQEAGGRSCLFPCRCRSCFRELPLTSTPGVSSPLWLSAPTPVRHLFFFFSFPLSLSSPCYTSSMSVRLGLGHADPPRLCTVPMRLQRGELSAHTPTWTRTHTPPVPGGFNRVLYNRGAVARFKRSFPVRAGESRLIVN